MTRLQLPYRAHRSQPRRRSAPNRIGPLDTMALGDRRLQLEILEQRRLLSIDPLNIPAWIPQGPAPQSSGYSLGLTDANGNANPVAGAIQAIAINPANINEVYVGTVNGGIWKSENAKSENTTIHWTAQTDAFASLSITAIAFDPSDASHNTLYAGTGTTSSDIVGEGDFGLLRTTDGGAHWQVISDSHFQEPGRIESIVPIINPATGKTRLLVGTDNYSAGGGANAGVLYCDNPLGAPPLPAPTFNFVPIVPHGSVTDLVSDPTPPTPTNPTPSKQLYAALYGQGIYQSPDAGKTWTPVTTGISAADLTATTAIKLAVSAAGTTGLPAGSSSPVYAAMLNQVPGVAVIQYQVSNVYSSINAGGNWVNMPALPPSPPPPAPPLLATDAFVASPGFYSHFSIAADPMNNALVYISGGAQQGTSSFYGTVLMGNRTPGSAWTFVDASGASANPADPNTPNPTAPHPDSRRMVFDATGQLWEGDDGGIYRLIAPSDSSLNAKSTGSLNRRWVSANGDLQITEFVSVAYDHNRAVLLGGAQDNNAAIQTSPSGKIWQRLAEAGGDGGVVQAQAASDGNVFEYDSSQQLSGLTQRIITQTGTVASTTPATLLLTNTVNSGQPLTLTNAAGTFLVDPSLGLMLAVPLVVNSLDPSRLLIGTAQLYESTDGGKTVTDITAQVAGGGALPGNVTAMAYGGRVKDPTSPGGYIVEPNLIYVAAGSSLYFRRAANAAFLTTTYGAAGSASATAGAVKAIAIDPEDYKTVYVVDANNHVWRTTDGGKTPTAWTDLTSNLSLPKNLSLDTIALVKANGNQALLVGGGGGVYRTLLPLANPLPGQPPVEIVWTNYGQGLPDAIVSDLHYDATADLLVVGTHGRGAWTLPNVSTSIFQDPVIHVTVTDSTNNVLISRDAVHPELVDVFVSSATTPDISVPMADVRQVVVTNQGGSAKFTVDSTNGPVSPLDGISFDGGTAVNMIVLTGPKPVQRNIPQPSASGNGSAAIVANDPLGFGPQLQDVTYTHVQNVSDGLPSLTASMDTLGSGLRKSSDLLLHQNALDTHVASLGGSLGSALEGITTSVPRPDSDPTSADPASQPPPSTGDSLLSRLIESGTGGFNFSSIEDVVEDGSISTPQDLLSALNNLGTTTLTQNGDITLYDFHATKTLTGQASLDVLDQALGGTIQLSGDLNLSADVAVHLQFGVDDSGFFIEPNAAGDPLFTISNIQVTGAVSGEGRLGILGVDLTNGTITIDSSVQLQLSLNPPANPEPDGLLRLSDLVAEGDSLLSATLTGGTAQKDVVLDGTFSIAAMGPGLSQPFSLASADVTITWPNVTDPTTITVAAQATAGQDLLDFLHGTPQNILDGMNKVGDFLDKYRNEPIFATQIPFTHGTTLGQVLDYGDAFRHKATDLLSAAEGTASFFTVQNLAVNLAAELGIDPTKLGMQYDPATHSLSYHVGFSQTLDPLSLPVDFSVHAGTLASFSTTSQLTITPQLDVGFDVGVDLSSLITGGNLTQDFFLSNAKLDGTVTATDSNFDATAQIGSITLHVTGGTLTATGAVSLALVDPSTGTAAGHLTLDELAGALTNPSSIIGNSSITASGTFHLPVAADPFMLGGATVALAGLVSGTDSSIDYSLSAGLSGALLPGLVFEPLPSGQFSLVTFSKANGLALDARLAIDGVQLTVTGAITPSDDFSLHVVADPFALGGLTVALDGNLTRTAGVVDYSLKADATGMLLPGLNIADQSPGVPTITLTSKNGLAIAARASAFGVQFNVTGQFQATDNFSLQVSANPFSIPGGGTVVLAGSIFRDASGLNWLLTGDVKNWQPVPFLTIADLAVALNSGGVTFDATTDIAGVNGIHLHGDYDFNSGAYVVTATAPVNWHLIDGVDLTNVVFAIGNRNADGSAGDTTVGASANVNLFGTSFNVAAHVTSAGSWIAATPADPASFKPIPGLTLSDEYVVASSYDFVLDLDKLNEVANPPSPLTAHERQINTGINLVATSQLPAAIPAIGGDEVEVQGVIGTSLAAMSIEAKIVLTQPWVLADVIEFDALGLRITGQPSLTVFGDGKILHDKIPGLGQDIGVEAGLTLTPTGLDGSLSLLSPVDNVFSVTGLNIVQANVSVGITFAAPIPPPKVGFNFVVQVPQPLQNLLSVPAQVSAALKTDPAQPIFALTVDNWRPFHVIGVDNVQVQEGSVVVAPLGGMIGTKTFQPGVSAEFKADILGTQVDFQGLFNQQTQGVLLEAYVSQFNLAGVTVTGPGPDGKLGDADDGAYFRAEFTPAKQALTFASLFMLPSANPSGLRQTAELDGDFNSQGIKLDGQITHWQPLGTSALDFNGTLKADLSFAATGLNLDFDVTAAVLGSNVEFVGSLFASPREFDIVATSTIALNVPGGGHFADLAATIDVGKDTPFSITLAGDFTLPGAQAGLVKLSGAIGSNAVTISGDVNHWQLVPGLSFDGSATMNVDLQAFTIQAQLDVNADLIGSNLNLQGQVTAGSSGLNLNNLHGEVVFGGKRVGFGTLDLKVNVASTTDALGGQSFQLGFQGDMFILHSFDLQATAQLTATSGGGFQLTTTVFVDRGANPDGSRKKLRLVDFTVPGIAEIYADFQASATLSFGSNLSDFNLTVGGQLTAGAHLFIGGISDPQIANIQIPNVAINLGQFTVPSAQIVIDTTTISAPKWLGGGSVTVATGVHLADLTVPWGTPVPDSTQVTAHIAQTLRQFELHLPGVLQIGGGNSPEHVEVGHLVFTIPGLFGAPSRTVDDITVQGADGGGDLVPVFETPTSDITGINISLSGPSSVINVDPSITLPVSIQASGGGDVIHGGGGPNTIDARQNGSTLAAISGGTLSTAKQNTAITIPTLPRNLFPSLPVDRGNTLVGGPSNDTIYGGLGNDVINGNGGTDTITPGPGINVINGVLTWQGDNEPKHLVVSRQTSSLRIIAAGGTPQDNIVLQLVNRLGTAVTLISVRTSELTGINLNTGDGDSEVDVSQTIDLPTTIVAGNGNDTINGGAGPNLIRHTGTGNDVLTGGPGNDTIYGGTGADTLVGGGGTDTLVKGSDQNVILDQSSQNQPPSVTGVPDETVEVGHLLSFTVTAKAPTPPSSGGQTNGGQTSGGQTGGGQTATTTFSAAGDFSATKNPNGPWSYGNESNGAFSLFSVSTTGGVPGLDGWTAPGAGGLFSPTPTYVIHNGSSSPIPVHSPNNLYLGNILPGQLVIVGPGVVRWTASAAGIYHVTATFTSVLQDVPDVETGSVLHDNAALFSGSGTFSQTVTLVAGDTLDFKVDVGFVALDATITLQPPGGFSAAGDFSAANNPNGAWSYGWSASRGSTFHDYPHHDGSSTTLEAWNDPSILQLGAPSVAFNPTDAVINPAGTNPIQPHQLAFHPGANGENSIVRWTAPASGTYLVQGSFGGIDSTTTDVAVLDDSGGPLESPLFNSNINGHGDTKPFSLSVTVQAGDHIDFTVGYGSDGNFFNDSTSIDATITLQSPGGFSAAGDFSAAKNPNGPWSYGSASSVGAAFQPLASLVVDSLTGWGVGSANDFTGVVHNGTSTTQHPPLFGLLPEGIAPGQLILAPPGGTSKPEIVRWTAPASGTYDVTAHFLELQTGAEDEVLVYHGSQQLFDANIVAPTAGTNLGHTSFITTVAVQAGDTIDFIAQLGGDAFPGYVALDATIVPHSTAPGAAGSVDTTFGNGGKVTTAFARFNATVGGAVLQSDGKMVVAGTGGDTKIALSRYNPNGTLDTTFGTNGTVTTDYGSAGTEGEGRDVAVQSDGRLVVAGFDFDPYTGLQHFVLARYNPDGSLDASFGLGGVEHYNLSGGGVDGAYAVAIQADGKIVAAGHSAVRSSLSHFSFGLARFNSNGSPDNTFGSLGGVITDFGTYTEAYHVLVQPDGKIVAVGYTASSFAMARYNSDGSLDQSFGTGGLVTTSFGANQSLALTAVLQPDGKIVVGGKAETNGDTSGSGVDFALARYNRDGSLDTTFGTGGKVTTDFANDLDAITRLVIQPDGKILAAGEARQSGTGLDFALARYNSDGTLDTSFGTGGKVTTDFFGQDDQGYGLILESDGNIVVAGTVHTRPDASEFGLVRYIGQNASTPPPPPPTPQHLTFSLEPGAPAGAAIDPQTGLFTWTPTADQGPATYTVGVRVTGDGTPPLSEVQSFTIAVTKPNAPPTLAAIADQTVTQFQLLKLSASATDPDLPAETLTYSLDRPPFGAAIDPLTGVLQWLPSLVNPPGKDSITVRVTDNGNPPESAKTKFNVTVLAFTPPPVNPPTHGKVISDASGHISFQPSASFHQVDSFSFGVTDATGKTDVGSARYVSPEFEQATKLYNKVLNRTPSDSEAAAWADLLVNHSDLLTLATGFINSDEHRAQVITNIFQQFLHRTPDADGLKFWLKQMRAGFSAEAVEIDVLVSHEYFALQGGTNVQFVRGLYHDLFDRTASDAESGFWVSKLVHGSGRLTVVGGFLSSTEYHSQLVNQFYEAYLGRAADASGLQYWDGQLASGISWEAVETALLASHEFAGIHTNLSK